MEYKIIADGACDLYGENADKIGVQIVPFYVAFEENVYKKEGAEIEVRHFYKEMVENDTILDAIADYSVKEGDCFFLPAGRIHSIGKGCFLAEIQQTSDVTYRIYDFKRKDKNGNYRELQTDLAAECLN